MPFRMRFPCRCWELSSPARRLRVRPQKLATCWSLQLTPRCRARPTPRLASAQGLRVLEKACPLLVPLVEEGWTDHAVTQEVIDIYLNELRAEAWSHGLNPDTLVLGCTHYPLLRPLIERAVRPGVNVIDSAEATAQVAAQIFNGRAGWPILSESATAASDRVGGTSSQAEQTEIRCFATDSVEKFERLGSRFLGRRWARLNCSIWAAEDRNSLCYPQKYGSAV